MGSHRQPRNARPYLISLIAVLGVAMMVLVFQILEPRERLAIDVSSPMPVPSPTSSQLWSITSPDTSKPSPIATTPAPPAEESPAPDSIPWRDVENAPESPWNPPAVQEPPVVAPSPEPSAPQPSVPAEPDPEPDPDPDTEPDPPLCELPVVDILCDL